MTTHEPSALQLLGKLLLKRDRERIGLSQEEVARRAGCNVADLIAIEEGRSEMSKGMALKLQEVLQLPNDRLYNAVQSRDTAKQKERKRRILKDISQH